MSRQILFLVFGLLIASCATTSTDAPTQLPPTDTPIPTSTSTSTTTITPTLTPTLTLTPSQTPIPPTPQRPDELVYNPEDSTLYDANSTPVYRLDGQGKWLAVVPEALLGILQEGWAATIVSDDSGVALFETTNDLGEVVFWVITDFQADASGKFPAWIQVEDK